MKKVLFVVAVAIFSTGVLVTSCSEDNPVSCTQKLVAVSDASSAFSLDPSATNCNAYRSALEDYIGCDGIAATDKTYYQTALDALDCSLY